MDFINLKSNRGEILDGLIKIVPDVFNDERGYFLEGWNESKLHQYLGKKLIFTQDNISKSKKDVIRGLHYQIQPQAQTKLVRCIHGSVFDVAVDIRKSSKTFGQWGAIELSEKNKFQLLVPEGYAHGFLCLEDNSIIYYKITKKWNKNLERALIWNDPEINISWPLKTNASISTKDNKANTLKEAIDSKDIFL